MVCQSRCHDPVYLIWGHGIYFLTHLVGKPSIHFLFCPSFTPPPPPPRLICPSYTPPPPLRLLFKQTLKSSKNFKPFKSPFHWHSFNKYFLLHFGSNAFNRFGPRQTDRLERYPQWTRAAMFSSWQSNLKALQIVLKAYAGCFTHNIPKKYIIYNAAHMIRWDKTSIKWTKTVEVVLQGEATLLS